MALPITPATAVHVMVVHHTAFPRVEGGIDTMIAALLSELPEQYRVSLLIPAAWEEPEPGQALVNGIMVHRLRLRSPYDRHRPLRGLLGWLIEAPRTLYRLRRLVRATGVEVIHLHTLQVYHGYFKLLSWWDDIPYLITFHGSEIRFFPARNWPGFAWILGWVARGAACWCGVAPDLVELARHRFGDAARREVVPNGLTPPDPGLLSAARAELAESAGIPARYFVMSGYFSRLKAQDVVIRAWGMLGKRHAGVHLLVVGEGPEAERAELAELAVAEGCSELVHFMGQLAQPRLFAIAERALGAVLPSRSEGMPYALLEYGWLGVPVICSTIPAFTWLITDDQEGLLVAVDSPAALAEGVERLVRDPALGTRLGQALREKVTARFTAAGMAARYGEIYGELATKRLP